MKVKATHTPAQAAKAARGHGHVLIEGETGTGKEMLMRAMHGASPRNKEALRTVNLASVPPGSIESVLFGHEPGSFPGAFDRQIGAFQHCDGGTLILDEIDRLTPVLQQRLAEALETGIIRPVGASYGFRVDVRLLVTSNAGLDLLVAGGQFDAALAARLGATRIHLPPLRDRTGDIPSLTRHFLARIGEQPGLNHLSISESALALLQAYDWPGNVRQLRNNIERLLILASGDADAPVTADMLPPDVGALVPSLPKAGRIVNERTIPDLGLTEWTLSNGVRVLVKPTDFKADQILVSAWSPGGRPSRPSAAWSCSRPAGCRGSRRTAPSPIRNGRRRRPRWRENTTPRWCRSMSPGPGRRCSTCLTGFRLA